MADTASIAATAEETDGAQRWYDALVKLDRLDELERRVEALEARQRQHDAGQAQAHSGETPQE